MENQLIKQIDDLTMLEKIQSDLDRAKSRSRLALSALLEGGQQHHSSEEGKRGIPTATNETTSGVGLNSETSHKTGDDSGHGDVTARLAHERASDLDRLTNFLRVQDKELEVSKSEIASMRKAVATQGDLIVNLTGQIGELTESSARSQISDASFRISARTTDQNAVIEKVVLNDLARTRLNDEEVRALALRSGLFDPFWYINEYEIGASNTNDAYEHFIQVGHDLGHNPSFKFDSRRYLHNNQDVAELKLNSLVHYIRFGACEGRTFHSINSKPTVKLIMMQKNETQLLHLWALYHASLFGFENLTIIDNGSNQAVRSRLNILAECGLNVIYDYPQQLDFVKKGDIISGLIQKMDAENEADFYIPIDCDEFIGVEKDGGFHFGIEDIIEELSNYKDCPDALTIPTNLDNHPSVPGLFKRVGRQRKSFFAAGSCTGLDRGFNNPTVREGGRRFTSLFFVHYHFRPFHLLQTHARLRLAPFIADMSAESLRQYVKDRKTGFHSANYLLMRNQEELLSRVDSSKYFHLPQLERAFTSLGLRLPFQEFFQITPS